MGVGGKKIKIKIKKAGDLLGKLMVMAWTCLVTVTMERSEWILEIFWGSVDTYCYVLGVAPLTDVGTMGTWEEESFIKGVSVLDTQISTVMFGYFSFYFTV